MKVALKKMAKSRIIVNAFKVTYVSPYNSGVFKESAYCLVGLDQANAEPSVIEGEFDEEEKRLVIVLS